MRLKSIDGWKNLEEPKKSRRTHRPPLTSVPGEKPRVSREDFPEILKLSEALPYLKMSRTAAIKKLGNGTIKGVREGKGKSWKIPFQSIVDYWHSLGLEFNYDEKKEA